MALTSVVVVLALAVSAHGRVGPSTNDSLCSESRECLEYQLLCKTEEYEVRRYSPTRWVSTDAEAYFMGVGAAMAFRRLFQYITGDNQGGYQMEMTAPVLVKIPEETRMWEPAIYTLSFPLPSGYQERPPQPNNDKLYFTDMPQMEVYVQSYGGWMLSVTSRLQAHRLTTELDRVRAAYNHSWHYGVGYDSPLKLLNRHNEVWYVAEGEPVCGDPQEPTPPHPAKRQGDQAYVDPANAPSDQPVDSSSDRPVHPSSDQPMDSSSDPPVHPSFDHQMDPSSSPASLQSDQPPKNLPNNTSLDTTSDPKDPSPVDPSSDSDLTQNEEPPEGLHDDPFSDPTPAPSSDPSPNPDNLQSNQPPKSSPMDTFLNHTTSEPMVDSSSSVNTSYSLSSPTIESPSQATSNTSSTRGPTSSLLPTDEAPSLATTSADSPLDLTSNSTQPEDPSHNEP